MSIEKYYYDKKYFKCYTKNKLLKIIKNNLDYENYFTTYKQLYLNSLSKKIKFLDINKCIIDDKKWTLNNDKDAKLYYLFFIQNKIPVGITKLLIIKLQNDFFEPIIRYLNCEYSDIVYVYNTFVLEDFRGKNINKLFITHINNNINKKYIIVVIENNNKISIASHLKSDFVKTDITAFNTDNFFYYKKINKI